MRSLLAGTFLFVSINGDSSTGASTSETTISSSTITSSTDEFDWSLYDMSSYYNDNCASILASTTIAPLSDSSSRSSSSSSSSSSSDTDTPTDSQSTNANSNGNSWHKYVNQYAGAYAGGDSNDGGAGTATGTGTGTDGASGSNYENQYKNYYGKYYGGTDGPGTYDNNNDGSNGQHKTQVIMCVCTKDSTDTKTGKLDQDGYSKCVNNAYGNNKKSWRNVWEKYVNKYKKDKSDVGTATADTADTATDAATRTDAVDAADAVDTDGTDLGLDSGTNTLDNIDDAEMQSDTGEGFGGYVVPETGEGEGEGAKENVQENSLEDEKSGLSNADDDTRHKKGSSKITHSEYMEYLAIFLIFIGAISFIAVGIHCVKYTYKAYRLRNYETIGENSKKAKARAKVEKIKSAHKRIRLPRREKRKNNIDNGDEYENEAFTIGEV